MLGEMHQFSPLSNTEFTFSLILKDPAWLNGYLILKFNKHFEKKNLTCLKYCQVVQCDETLPSTSLPCFYKNLKKEGNFYIESSKSPKRRARYFGDFLKYVKPLSSY